MASFVFDLPEDVFGAVTADPERIAAEFRFAAAVHWYQRGKLSGGKAARVAGLSRVEFLEELHRRKIDRGTFDLPRLRAEVADLAADGPIWSSPEN